MTIPRHKRKHHADAYSFRSKSCWMRQSLCMHSTSTSPVHTAELTMRFTNIFLRGAVTCGHHLFWRHTDSTHKVSFKRTQITLSPPFFSSHDPTKIRDVKIHTIHCGAPLSRWLHNIVRLIHMMIPSTSSRTMGTRFNHPQTSVFPPPHLTPALRACFPLSCLPPCLRQRRTPVATL